MNGISVTRLSHSQIQRNQISGAVVDGIRTASFGGVLRGAAQNLFASNQVSGAGRAGIFADRACNNQFASNDLRGNAGDLGLFRSEEHTSELQSHSDLVCRLLLEKKKMSLATCNKTCQWPLQIEAT